MLVGKGAGKKQRGRCLALGKKMARRQGRIKLQDTARARISLVCCSNGGRLMKGGQKVKDCKSTIFRKVTRSV